MLRPAAPVRRGPPRQPGGAGEQRKLLARRREAGRRARARRGDAGREAQERQLNRRINEAAAGQRLVALLEDDRVMEDPGWNDVNVATALFRSASPHSDADVWRPWMRAEPLPLEVLEQLKLRLDTFLAYNPGFRATERSVASALYGLQVQEDTAESRGLLRSITRLARTSREALTPQGAANALYGLQRQGAHKETVELLGALRIRIERGSARWGPQEVANALYGLQRQNPSAAMDRLLAALAARVAACPGPLRAQDVGCAFYGLHRQKPSEAVAEVVAALAQHIPSCEPLDAQAVGCAIYGLRLLSSMESVDGVLDALSERVERAGEELDAQAVGSSLFALRGRNATSGAMRRMVTVLAKHMAACSWGDHPLDTVGAGHTMYGMMSHMRHVAVQGAESDAAASPLPGAAQFHREWTPEMAGMRDLLRSSSRRCRSR